MPVDWTQYLATNKTADYIADQGGTRVQTASNGVGDLVSRIIESQFSNYTSGVNTKISPEKAADGALSEYGGLSGDVIKLGKVSAPMGISETLKGKQKGQTWNGNGAYVDTAQVLDGVASTLHELYHARTATAHSAGYVGDPSLGKDWKAMLDDAGKADFPSVSTAIGGGDRLEEFLATAVPITDLRAKGITLSSGRMRGLPEELDKLVTKYPWVPGFIKANSDPQAKAAAAKPQPSKGLVGSILDFFK